jgi:demethylmenaquinone methyltransferase/2-methoxy-6-polyprenyl-1,4-benzoquinol methylase
MAESYYNPGAERATKVRQLFSRIANRYDLLNDLQSFGLHRQWKRRVVALAALKPNQKALDVCCGTGDLTFGLAESGAEVLGLDFTNEMLARAALRKSRKPGQNVSFIQGDAQSLPFENASFDSVTVGYGLRNLADWQKGLAEMVRVVRPGGRVVVLEFGKPSWKPWRAVYFGYLRLLVPILGWAAAGDRRAYSYILESLQQYPGQVAVENAMRELGLGSLRTFNILGGAMSINYGVKESYEKSH